MNIQMRPISMSSFVLQCTATVFSYSCLTLAVKIQTIFSCPQEQQKCGRKTLTDSLYSFRAGIIERDRQEKHRCRHRQKVR